MNQLNILLLAFIALITQVSSHEVGNGLVDGMNGGMDNMDNMGGIKHNENDGKKYADNDEKKSKNDKEKKDKKHKKDKKKDKKKKSSSSESSSSDETILPTIHPSNIPTIFPTNIPTINPTNIPTKYPTNIPTKYPTNIPTKYPTNIPTIYPTDVPTYPTCAPTPIFSRRRIPCGRRRLLSVDVLEYVVDESHVMFVIFSILMGVSLGICVISLCKIISTKTTKTNIENNLEYVKIEHERTN